jgi:hypothetical protein
MKIHTIRCSKVSKGQTLIVKNRSEYEFAKLNFNKNVKIIIRNDNEKHCKDTNREKLNSFYCL